MRVAATALRSSILLPLMWLSSLPIKADTLVSGQISTSTTWTLAGSPYIVTGDVEVRSAVTPVPVLTIQPGVTVKFNSGRALNVGSQYPGELQAVGTAAQPIVFTANTATPSAGFWVGVRLLASAASTSRLTYATVTYGGGNGNLGAIDIVGSSPTLQNVTAQNNAYAGISVTGGSPTISNSTLSNNPWGLWVQSTSNVTVTSTTISSNTSGGIYVADSAYGAVTPTFSLSTVSIINNTGYAMSLEPRMTLGTISSLTVTGNTNNAVEIRGGNADRSATWKLLTIPYVVTGDVLVQNPVAPVPVLTIQAGVTVKFNAGRNLIVGWPYSGELQAVGTAAQPILFTANTATPTPGFWYAVRFAAYAVSTSRVSYATVSYGGASGTSGGITVEGSSPTLQNITAQNNAHAGIAVNGGSPTISNSTLSSNPWGLWIQQTATVTVTSTTISSNTSGGIYVADSAYGAVTPTFSLSTVSITNNTGYAMSLESRMTLGTVSALTVTGNTNNAAEIRGGNADRSATWKLLTIPYVVTGDVLVQNPVAPVPVLTIQAGVTVKFNAGRSLLIGAPYAGELQAVGTSAQSIIFTANTATPTAGFWAGLRFGAYAAATSRLTYATVTYGGINGNWGGIDLAGSSPVLQNVTAQNNAHAGISVNGGSPTISSSTLSNNTWGLWVQNTSTVTLTSTTISNNTSGGIYGVQSAPTPPVISLSSVSITNNTGYAMSLDPRMTLGTISSLTVTGNTNNAVEIRGGVVDLNTTWKLLAVPYVVTGGVTVQKSGSASTLTIPAGSTIKFNAGRVLKIGETYPGKLTAIGTSASRIVFTANTASPSLGYWQGISFTAQASATSKIAYADVSYGGIAGNWGGVHASAGITFDHVRFASNAYAGLSIYAASPVVTNCDFTSNAAGLVNQTVGTVVDARLNWWNAATGPSGSGPGTGQYVSAGTRYEPWLTTAGAAPQSITTFALGNRTFNPAIGVNANFTFGTAQSGTWTLAVVNGGGFTVRTLTGTGTTGAAAWNGKNDSGVDQPDGTYTYQLSSTAGANSAAPAKGFSIIDRTRQLTASGVTVAPPFFSPNGDAVQDTTALTATSSFDGATWTVNVKNSGGTVVRTATGNADPAISYVWNGRNASNTIQPDGPYTLELILTDGPASITYTPTSTLDRTLPTAAITAPASGMTLSNVYQSGATDVSVVGTSNDANLLNWILDVGPAWYNIATGTAPVLAANLGTFATLPLTNASYNLRLRVWDKAGNLSTLTRTHPVSNFKVSANTRAFNGGAGGTVQYTSTVPFTLTETLVIKNQAGQTIRTLFTGSRVAGSFVDPWNGRNDAAVLLLDGPYFYVATATAGSNSMTWDLTNQYLNDYNTSSTGSVYAGAGAFEPFNNIPLSLNYDFNLAAAMEPGRVWLYFTPDIGYLQTLTAMPDPATCYQPPNFCVPDGEYQPSGSYTRTWSGLDLTSVLRKDIQAIVFMVRRDNFSKNAVVLHGTRPALTNLRVTPPYYNPSTGSQTISLNLTTFQSQSVSATIAIMNLETRSVLRSLTRTGQAPGLVTFTWDGRADNGMWVAAGGYAVTANVTDGLGNAVTSQILTTVRY